MTSPISIIKSACLEGKEKVSWDEKSMIPHVCIFYEV